MKKILLLTTSLFYFTFLNAQVPAFHSVKQMGGSGSERGQFITLDASGNVYTTGSFQGIVDFDPGAGTVNLSSNGGDDIFISKMDASGNLLWAKSMGDTLNEYGYSIAVDASGNVYTTGHFSGTVDFDGGAGTTTLSSNGNEDIFVTKYDAAGTFVWAKNMGGATSDFGRALTVDATGNVYVTGFFDGTSDFDPNAGTSNLTSTGLYDIFIAKLDATGNFVWAKNIGSTTFDVGNSIVIDASGNVYTTGYFGGTADFDPGAGTANLTSTGANDIFILKLDGAGNFVWAKNMGGTSNDIGFSIAVDPSGDIYSTGTFGGNADLDPGAASFSLTSNGSNDVYISKLSAAGNFIWAKGFGSTTADYVYGITTDPSGNVYTTGYFQGTVDFDPGVGTNSITSTGNYDIFISKLNGGGNYTWAINLGGTARDYAYSLAVDPSGNVYTTGWFEGTADFDPGSATVNLTSAGAFDIFILKIFQSPIGIKENLFENNISVYPNPTKDILNVELEMINSSVIKFQIVTALGQVVMSESTDINHLSFNIQHLPNGLYFMNVISDGKIIATQKIVKE
ncbi:MAG: SBBP repeat-containing protein [Bacteroidota bacterium]|nr:SBBP repeat-containing protein [Bacteroidota bacterium]